MITSSRAASITAVPRPASAGNVPGDDGALPATTAEETDQITRTVSLYVEGVRDGDAAELREAFHPDARMWGSMMGRRFDEMIAMVDGKPVDVDGSYRAHVTSVVVDFRPRRSAPSCCA